MRPRPARATTSPATPPTLPSFGGGPSFGIDVGTAIGSGEFADPVPMQGAGFLGGLRLGYDWKLTDHVLIGFETDAQYRSDLGGGSNGHASISGVRGGYLGTARARLGYVFDRWLVYGTGGLAYGHILAPRSFSGAGVINSFNTYGISQSYEFVPGWTIGAGVQYALFPGLSLRAEYLFTRLQHSNPTYMTSAAPVPVEVCNQVGDAWRARRRRFRLLAGGFFRTLEELTQGDRLAEDIPGLSAATHCRRASERL